MRFQGVLTVVLLAFIFMGTSLKDESQAASTRLEQLHAKRGIACERCHGKKPKKERVSMETCLGCHGSYQTLAESSKGKSPNPHESHIGEVRCTLCHHVHKDSEMYCNQCHTFELKMP
jgi:RecJ-like exonuclease